MFGSDKKQGFLTGTPGGAVTRTPKKTGPALTSTGSGPVTSLPNPVVGSNPAPKGVAEARGKPVRTPPVAPKGVAAARGVPVRTPQATPAPVAPPAPPAATQVATRNIPTTAGQTQTGQKAKSNYNTVRHGQGVVQNGLNGLRAQSPGRGLWSAITSQMTPGRWFSK